MDELHDWNDPGDQLAISVSIFFKHLRLVSDHNKDLIWGTAEFELIAEVVFSEDDSRLFGVVLQCVIKDKLKPGC